MLNLYVQFTNGINEKQYRFFKGYIWIKSKFYSWEQPTVKRILPVFIYEGAAV